MTLVNTEHNQHHDLFFVFEFEVLFVCREGKREILTVISKFCVAWNIGGPRCICFAVNIYHDWNCNWKYRKVTSMGNWFLVSELPVGSFLNICSRKFWKLLVFKGEKNMISISIWTYCWNVMLICYLFLNRIVIHVQYDPEDN